MKKDPFLIIISHCSLLFFWLHGGPLADTHTRKWGLKELQGLPRERSNRMFAPFGRGCDQKSTTKDTELLDGTILQVLCEQWLENEIRCWRGSIPDRPGGSHCSLSHAIRGAPCLLNICLHVFSFISLVHTFFFKVLKFFIARGAFKSYQ